MSKRKKKRQNNQQAVSASCQNEQQRGYLKLDNIGVYFAKVVYIDENKAVLKNVVIDGIRHDGIRFMESEDHVNIFNAKDIKILKEKTCIRDAKSASWLNLMNTKEKMEALTFLFVTSLILKLLMTIIYQQKKN